MHDPVCWTRLAAAMEFYRGLGFKYVDVPWVVEQDAMEVTLPVERPACYCECVGGLGTQVPTDGYLIGSGEQGFIDMIQQGLSLPDMAMTCTPCFRVENHHDEFTKPYFMKVELFVSHGTKFEDLCGMARRFMMKFGKTIDIVPTREGLDLMLDGIEVGSYGKRLIPEWGEFVYGTGLAEPRFTAALARKK